MVKLRGINLFPTGIGALLVEHAEGATGEFLCRVHREGARDAMTAHLEIRGPREAALRERLEAMLRSRLGVEIAVALEAPGALAERTQVEHRQKAIRLLDERK
jgi:phenylacetate-CoA ligase